MVNRAKIRTPPFPVLAVGFTRLRSLYSFLFLVFASLKTKASCLAPYQKLRRMAGNPVDPLQALSAALAVPADSKEQADLLSALRESLEAHPHPIPILCTTLIKTVSGAGDSLLKRWVLELLQFAICRSSLTLEARTTRQFPYSKTLKFHH